MSVRTKTAMVVTAWTLVVVALVIGAMFLGNRLGSSGSAVQYPAGQRPCNESLAALDAVTMAQLDAGPGPNDPDGAVREALEEAREVLGYRAGESQYYSAYDYNMAADHVIDTIGPLLDAYEQEDLDTPYTEVPDFIFLQGDYSDARRALEDECRT